MAKSYDSIDLYNCDLCFINFNTSNNKPYSLYPCGHTFCLECINKLKYNKCPIDREQFDGKAPNFWIIKNMPKENLPAETVNEEIQRCQLKLDSMRSQFMTLMMKKQLEVQQIKGEIKSSADVLVEEFARMVMIEKEKLLEDANNMIPSYQEVQVSWEDVQKKYDDLFKNYQQCYSNNLAETNKLVEIKKEIKAKEDSIKISMNNLQLKSFEPCWNFQVIRLAN
jgi:hypothetical protein